MRLGTYKKLYYETWAVVSDRISKHKLGDQKRKCPLAGEEVMLLASELFVQQAMAEDMVEDMVGMEEGMEEMGEQDAEEEVVEMEEGAAGVVAVVAAVVAVEAVVVGER